MMHKYRKPTGWFLLVLGPFLGASNLVTLAYTDFDLTDAVGAPGTLGNFMIGFLGMSLMLTGRNLLRKTEDADTADYETEFT
ncbi:hypothetical protein SAMN05421823_103101 [Catalinimonas alkaloidigena]|uniref:Uncharacterized protein n=1 Tax=Catalinimonas alkaloidigena TaxID=1075417 RepID=A0A1G9DEF5_9BACT|nr:hypothetical protein [Catalinimonas alkaloidigena]SDK62256.1 hypothetical protein SAMN05421823_103101 [Catalinimonas alkaloidigena]